MPCSSSLWRMPRLRAFRIASVVFALLALFPSSAPARGKDHLVEHPTFYRTTQIDGLSIFYREGRS